MLVQKRSMSIIKDRENTWIRQNEKYPRWNLQGEKEMVEVCLHPNGNMPMLEFKNYLVSWSWSELLKIAEREILKREKTIAKAKKRKEAEIRRQVDPPMTGEETATWLLKRLKNMK